MCRRHATMKTEFSLFYAFCVQEKTVKTNENDGAEVLVDYSNEDKPNIGVILCNLSTNHNTALKLRLHFKL